MLHLGGRLLSTPASVVRSGIFLRSVSTRATKDGTENYFENRWFPQQHLDTLPPSIEEQKRINLVKEKRQREQKITGIKNTIQIYPQYHERSGLVIPPLSLSCLRLSTQNSEHYEMLPCAVNQGINLFESSTIYPDSQFIVGEAIKEFPSDISRDQVILLSKAGFKVTQTASVCDGIYFLDFRS